MLKKIILILFVIECCLFYANCIDLKAEEDAFVKISVNKIIEKSENIMRGKTSVASMEMIVKTKRYTRTIKIKSWTKGKNKSFIKILYPPRDKGINFLRLDREMWQYVPKIERNIKIPPSMMLQSWMGSDFTNDDLVKESSLIDDYDAKLLAEEEKTFKIELIPKPDSAVTWGRIIYWIDKTNYLPLKEDFYDEDNILVNELTFSEVKKFNDRYYPTKLVMIPFDEAKIQNSTTLIIKDITFNQSIDDDIFSLKSLKSNSI